MFHFTNYSPRNTPPGWACFLLGICWSTTYRAAGPREASRHANDTDAQNGVGHGSNAGEYGRGARYSLRASGDAGAIAAGHCVSIQLRGGQDSLPKDKGPGEGKEGPVLRNHELLLCKATPGTHTPQQPRLRRDQARSVLVLVLGFL